MFAKIKEIEERYGELEGRLSSPEIVKDPKAYKRYAKEHSMLAPIVSTYRQYESVQEEIESNRSLLDDPDPEMRKLAREEIENLNSSLQKLQKDLKALLLPCHSLALRLLTPSE